MMDFFLFFPEFFSIQNRASPFKSSKLCINCVCFVNYVEFRIVFLCTMALDFMHEKRDNLLMDKGLMRLFQKIFISVKEEYK